MFFNFYFLIKLLNNILLFKLPFKLEKTVKISVVVALYNCKDTIFRFVDSVLNQKYREFELILVDDCSTDSTIEALSSYSDDRIILLKTEQNSGAGVARKVGFDIASGDIVYAADPDDVLIPDVFNAVVTQFKSSSVDIVAVGFEKITDESGHLKTTTISHNPKTLSQEQFRSDILSGKVPVVNSLWGYYFLKKLLRNVERHTGFGPVNDMPVTLPVLFSATSIHFSSIIGYRYICHSENETNKSYDQSRLFRYIENNKLVLSNLTTIIDSQEIVSFYAYRQVKKVARKLVRSTNTSSKLMKLFYSYYKPFLKWEFANKKVYILFHLHLYTLHHILFRIRKRFFGR